MGKINIWIFKEVSGKAKCAYKVRDFGAGVQLNRIKERAENSHPHGILPQKSTQHFTTGSPLAGPRRCTKHESPSLVSVATLSSLWEGGFTEKKKKEVLRRTGNALNRALVSEWVVHLHRGSWGVQSSWEILPPVSFPPQSPWGTRFISAKLARIKVMLAKSNEEAQTIIS